MAKIPTILEAGRADGILIKTDNVYYDNQKKFLSDKLEEIDNNHSALNNTVNNNELDIENKLEAEKTRATNTENNLRETINNIMANPGQVSNAENVIVNTLPNSTASNVQQALNDLYENIIYDVSARNGGVTFESLSALLSSSNLSMLIPASVRHGGMSIRFLRRSDNKYVQFRLMSESFNTTESNWQGVDDIPTAGSNNLVKSGGVDLIVNGFCPFEQGGISSQTGENDNTRPMQFRTKEYWAISGSPTISATDPNGKSLEVGTRYYDITKTFVGYTYKDRARFVRIVVVANVEVTQGYLGGCTVVLNEEIIKKTSGAVSAEIVTFNDAKTETKGKNVQVVIENIDKNINSMLNGYNPFEQGGISSSTGLDDDTPSNQFRSKAIYEISTAPTITTVDGNGTNLVTGVRFYNKSREYVGYTYSVNAKFVRFVVVSNLTNISEEYIKECTVTFNSEIIKFISSVNSSKGTSFDDKNTKIKGETVQKVIENIDATVNSEINGDFSLEKGGINTYTGVNDNTIQTQFRTKDFLPITSNPIVSATDSYGNVLDLGKRFYDENKNYIESSYTNDAVYVKIVVNAYITVTEEYLSGCTIIINGNELKNIIGTKFAAGISFDDSRTELKGETVQNIIESIDKIIYGYFPIEQGGISSQTGKNDNSTLLTQLRTKDYYIINGSPTISAKDPKGNYLEVGTRYYNKDKGFVGYTYTESACYVRIVVVANQAITEDYINNCVIVLNGFEIKTISSVNSFIYGNNVFEQGGISSQTGENDNTRPMQFRSKMFPISANPTITATDKYGNSLVVGVRFYDASRNYLTYSYPGSSAKFVRLVVVCNGVAYKKVIADTKVILNGQVLVQKDSVNLGSGIEFNSNGTNIIGNNVQSAIEFVNDDKKGIHPIIVSTWNVGQFGGGAGTSSIVPSNYNQKVLKWNKKVRGIYADLCGMQEYHPVFGRNVNNDKCSPNDVVWDFYKYFEVFRQPEIAYYWGGNGIGSQMKLSNAQKVKYECNKGVTAPDSTTQRLLDEVAFYTLADMQLMGVTVKVACCTTAFNASDSTDNTYQAAQYAELVEKFRDYDHVILMGDFETVDDSSLSVFTSNGFNICNGGAFGWFKTCPTTTLGNGHLDNIIVKGFDVVDVKMDVNDLSDHYPLIAQLLIKE